LIKQGHSRWGRWWLLYGLSAVAVVVCLPHLSGGLHGVIRAIESHLTAASGPGPKVGAGTGEVADVPDRVVHSVAQHLTGVPGVDELVVLPKDGGYLVSATVNLTSTTAGSQRTAIAGDVASFFSGIFASDPHIREGQLYLLSDGQIVASAGLGVDAYRKLHVTAMSGDALNLTEEMKGQPQVNAGGANDCWFQVNVNGLDETAAPTARSASGPGGD
jgi:hypothetical protein